MDELEVRSSKETTDTNTLRSRQEEASTKLSMYVLHCQFNTVVSSRPAEG